MSEWPAILQPRGTGTFWGKNNSHCIRLVDQYLASRPGEFARCRQEWLKGLARTGEEDEAAAADAVHLLYRADDRIAPAVYWADDPVAAMHTIWDLADRKEAGSINRRPFPFSRTDHVEFVCSHLVGGQVSRLYETMWEKILEEARQAVANSGRGAPKDPAPVRLGGRTLRGRDNGDRAALRSLAPVAVSGTPLSGHDHEVWARWATVRDRADRILWLGGPRIREHRPLADAALTVAATCTYWWALEHAAVLCRKPVELHVNDDGLHGDGGPAVMFGGGFALWCLSGVKVSRTMAETPAEYIDPEAVMEEENVEVRAALIRKIGLERLLEHLQPVCVDLKGKYELLYANVRRGMYEFLKMTNPSTGETHIEGVAPGTRTVTDALAWRNGTRERPVIVT